MYVRDDTKHIHTYLNTGKNSVEEGVNIYNMLVLRRVHLPSFVHLRNSQTVSIMICVTAIIIVSNKNTLSSLISNSISAAAALFISSTSWAITCKHLKQPSKNKQTFGEPKNWNFVLKIKTDSKIKSDHPGFPYRRPLKSHCVAVEFEYAATCDLRSASDASTAIRSVILDMVSYTWHRRFY